MSVLIRAITETPEFLSEVEEIFFETSARQNFESQIEKEKFLYKYLHYYYEKYSHLFLLAFEEGHLLGYVCGAKSTDEEIFELQPHLGVFSSEINLFPAHLHINLTQRARGKGLGTILINEFCSKVGCSHVHIVTSPNAKNKSFYLKNNFNFLEQKNYNGAELLFMGKTLS